MAAVISPPHLLPGLAGFPRRTAARPRRAAPRTAPSSIRTTAPTAAPTVAPAVPSPATYARRRAVALLMLLAVALAVQVVVAQLAAGAWSSTHVARPAQVTTAAATDVQGSASAGAVPSTAHAAAAPTVYVVRSGDTLWSIAQRLQPGADPRPLVDALAERAGSSSLRPGQRIDLDGLAL